MLNDRLLERRRNDGRSSQRLGTICNDLTERCLGRSAVSFHSVVEDGTDVSFMISSKTSGRFAATANKALDAPEGCRLPSSQYLNSADTDP